jgi:hypothetical protein
LSGVAEEKYISTSRGLGIPDGNWATMKGERGIIGNRENEQ